MSYKILKLGLSVLVLATGTAVLRAYEPAPPSSQPVGTPPQIVPKAPVAIPPVPAAALLKQGPSGKIAFETPIYDFGRARAGDPVKHTFIFTNIGDATLEIKSVHPGCGCTTAGEWTKKVEPGKTGEIPIQVNVAANWPAAPIVKTVSVDSNDRTQPLVTLQIKGNVWKPVEVNPAFAVLNIPADAPRASTVIRITSNLEEPLKLQLPESNNKSFTTQLRETKPGKEFELTVTANVPITNAQGQITLKTSATNSPEITVTAWANVQPAIAIMPPSITLPAGPLPNKSTPTVNIQNNGTNTLKLSDGALTGMPGLDNVEIKIQESQPGKQFAVMVSFPEGFTIPQGQHVELSLKSSHPQYPTIKIPVNQIPGLGHPVVPVKPATTSQFPLPLPGHTAAAK